MNCSWFVAFSGTSSDYEKVSQEKKDENFYTKKVEKLINDIKNSKPKENLSEKKITDIVQRTNEIPIGNFSADDIGAGLVFSSKIATSPDLSKFFNKELQKCAKSNLKEIPTSCILFKPA